MGKEKLGEAEKAGTEALIALEVEKARNEESEKQHAGWRESQAQAAASNAGAMRNREQEEAIKRQYEQELDTMKVDIQSKMDRIKELESELVLTESQFARAVADSEAANARAESKDKDMSELMKSIREMQSSGQNREEEAKVAELEKTLAVTRGELNVFTHEKSSLKDSLETMKGEKADALEKLNELKEKMEVIKTDLNDTSSQLALEQELRSRSELKEREERNERIALSAQMVAMTKDHAQMEMQLNEAKDVLEAKWRKQLDSKDEIYQEKVDELEKTNEVIAGLHGEIEALKVSLENEK